MKDQITNEILDELLMGCERPEDVLSADGLMMHLKKGADEP